MDGMIAYCGLVCSTCDAFTATQANDAEAIGQLVQKAAQQLNMQVTPDDVWCDGCLSAGPRLCSHCADCAIRACALSRGVVNCAHCDDYGCEIISGFMINVPQAQAVLEDIRAGL